MKKQSLFVFFAFVLSLGFISTVLFADTIYLSSGEIYTGNVVKEDDRSLEIQLKPGYSIMVDREAIENIEKSNDLPEKPLEELPLAGSDDKSKSGDELEILEKPLQKLPLPDSAENSKTVDADKAGLADGTVSELPQTQPTDAVPENDNPETNDKTIKGAVDSYRSAIDAYRAEHGYQYPTSKDQLFSGEKQYLSDMFRNDTLHGYRLNIILQEVGYEITAEPVECRKTGTKIYRVKSGDPTIYESSCSL